MLRNLSIYWLAIWGIAALAGLAILRRLRDKCCFGHKKKWVAVYKFNKGSCPAEDGHSYRDSGIHYDDDPVQLGRWVCQREGCLAMGEKCFGLIKNRVFRIEHGKLVPDEKAWSNPEEEA